MNIKEFSALLVFGAVLAAIIMAFTVAISNYKECRSRNFSRLYCATTHLVR